jgi:regulator of sigma E protease
MEFLNSAFWLLVLLGVMIIIHELGHYWAALLCDVRVESFSLGFGPRLFGFKIGETDFRFSAILFGGYVKMLGQDDLAVDAGTNPDPRSFMNKPRYQRLFIAAAGPAMNILLSIAILTGLYMNRFPKEPNPKSTAVVGHIEKGSPAALAGVQENDTIVEFDGKKNPTWDDIGLDTLLAAGQVIPIKVKRGETGPVVDLNVTPKTDPRTQAGYIGWREQGEVRVTGLRKGYAAEQAGLKAGDIVISANNQPVRSTSKLIEIVTETKGAPIDLVYSRNDQRNKVVVQPKYDDSVKRWLIGVDMQPAYVIVKLGFMEAFEESIKANLKGATLIFRTVKGMLMMRISPKQLDGPVRIASLAADAAKGGVEHFLSLMALVSLNLAIFNLLPIPVLDGGMILVLLIEMIRGRDLPLQFKERVLQVGLAFLLMMVVFVLYNDISKVLMPKS